MSSWPDGRRRSVPHTLHPHAMIPTMHSPVPHHLPVRRTSPRRLLAALCVTGLALSGCSFGKDDVETSPKSPGDDSAASSEAADAPPAIVEDEGFYRANTLQEPIAEQVVEVPSPEGMSRARLEVLSLDSDGTNARMVLAWLPPTDGPVAQPDELVAEAQSNNSRPWVRLVDLDKRTLTESLQLDSPGASFQGNEPVASQLEEAEANPQRKGAAISSYAGGSSIEAGEPDATDLIYIDFPAPESEKVTVLAGDSIAPLTDVPVSSQQPFDAAGELAQFRYVAARDGKELPGDYGAGATRMRSVPLELSTESVTGASVDDKGEQKSLTLKADVLFALDADTLDAKADGVISSAADELKRSAQGRTVTIEGHTDDQGEDDYNQSLSERRAEAVRKAIEPKLDGADITLETKGFGESQPKVPNAGADGQPIEKNRAINRRVSFAYAPAADVNPNVDTGEKLADIPEMKPADGASSGSAPSGDASDSASGSPDASGGQAPIASGILAPPEGNPGPELQIDVNSLSEAGDYYVLDYSFRTADGSDDEQALAGDPTKPEALHFGENAQTTLRSSATSAIPLTRQKPSELPSDQPPLKHSAAACVEAEHLPLAGVAVEGADRTLGIVGVEAVDPVGDVFGAGVRPQHLAHAAEVEFEHRVHIEVVEPVTEGLGRFDDAAQPRLLVHHLMGPFDAGSGGDDRGVDADPEAAVGSISADDAVVVRVDRQPPHRGDVPGGGAGEDAGVRVVLHPLDPLAGGPTARGLGHEHVELRARMGFHESVEGVPAADVVLHRADPVEAVAGLSADEEDRGAAVGIGDGVRRQTDEPLISVSGDEAVDDIPVGADRVVAELLVHRHRLEDPQLNGIAPLITHDLTLTSAPSSALGVCTSLCTGIAAAAAAAFLDSFAFYPVLSHNGVQTSPAQFGRHDTSETAG